MHGSGNQSYMDRLYVLPRTGERVLSERFQACSENDQVEIAVYWFMLNCRQRSDPSGTSDALSAIEPLASEFDHASDGNGLSRELLQRIADHLPGSWERLGGAPEIYRRSMVHAGTSSQPSLQERREAILEAVEHARTLLMQEQPTQQQQGKPPTIGESEASNEQIEPSLGHNSKGEKALSNDQGKELDEILHKVQIGIRLGSQEGDEAARTEIAKTTSFMNILGEWISKGILQGTVMEGAKIVGSEIVKNTGLHWCCQYIGDLISSIFQGPFT